MFNTDFDWLGAYSKQIKDVLTSAHNHGYAEGFDRAKREYGESRGIAHCHRATQEEVEMHGVELWGWCDCGKPIEGRWVGMANFCPWCGKVMEWGEKHENRD